MSVTEMLTEYWWVLPLLLMVYCCLRSGGCRCGNVYRERKTREEHSSLSNNQ